VTQTDALWTAVLFAGFGLAVLLAVHGWMRAWEVLLGKRPGRSRAAGWLASAVVHTTAAAMAWYTLAFLLPG
jgi:hypothetical protein